MFLSRREVRYNVLLCITGHVLHSIWRVWEKSQCVVPPLHLRVYSTRFVFLVNFAVQERSQHRCCPCFNLGGPFPMLIVQSFCALCILLVIGKILRSFLPIFQRLYLP